MRKSVTLAIIFILNLSAIFTVCIVLAQNAPLTPEFTVQIVDQSFDVAPTYTIDPYTGQNLTATNGYHVEKRFIEVKIKNPPTLSYSNGDKLYYNIRFKGHYEQWGGEPTSESNIVPEGEYTSIRYGFGRENPGGFTIWLGYVAPGGMIDFQAEAILGHYTKVQGTPDVCYRATEYSVFTPTGKSGWSQTQTISVDALPVATPEPTSTPTPSESESPSVSSSPSLSVSPSESSTPSESVSPLPTVAPSTSPLAALDTSMYVIVGLLVVVVILSFAVVFALRRKKEK